MSKRTNTVVYFDWKTVIYIYVCGKCRTQFMLPMKKSVTFTGACANEIAGADPGFYVRGRTSWRGVWGTPRSSAGPGQRPVGDRGG